MSIIIWVVVGVVVGRLASAIMRTHTMFNVGVGVVGALVAGVLVAPLTTPNEVVSPNVVTIGGVLSALLGAVILIVIVELFRRDPSR